MANERSAPRTRVLAHVLACAVAGAGGAASAQVAWRRSGPEPRIAPAVAYEPNTGFGYLYGGTRPGNPPVFLPELWRHQRGRWHRVQTPTPGPTEPGRAVTWPGRGMLYVAGSESWLFDGSDWSQIATSNPAPDLDALAYDAASDQFVGWRDPSFGGTWSFDGSTWQAEVPSVVPTGASAVMAWHQNLSRVLMVVQTGGNTRRVYSWTGSDWHAESPTMIGFGEGSSAAATPHGDVVVSGGFAFPFSYGSMLFWPMPPNLAANGVVPLLRKVSHSWYDPVRRRTVMTSGADVQNGNRTTIYFDVNGWHYEQAGRLPWSTSSMAYDTWRGQLLMFGGLRWNDAEHGEVWRFDGDEWSYLDAMPSWARVQQASVAFDSRRGRMIVFGGGRFDHGGGVWLPYGGVFLEWDGVSWLSRVPPVGTVWPELRIGAGLAYDAVRSRTVLFGGRKLLSQGILRSDTWEWDGATWIERQPATVPPAANGKLVFDASRGACVLAAGSDLWQWDGDNWLTLGVGLPTASGQLVHDPARGALLWLSATQGTFELQGSSWGPVRDQQSFGVVNFDPGRGALVGYDQGGTFTYGDRAAASIQSVGVGCRDNLDAMTLHGEAPPRLGSTVVLRLENAPLPRVYLAVVGSEAASLLGKRLPLDLTPLGMTGCDLHVRPELQAVRSAAAWPIPIPALPVLLGGRFVAQTFALDPGANPLGIRASNAVRLRVGS